MNIKALKTRYLLVLIEVLLICLVLLIPLDLLEFLSLRVIGEPPINGLTWMEGVESLNGSIFMRILAIDGILIMFFMIPIILKSMRAITMKLNGKDYYNKVYGGWLGRVIGSQLGAPLEIRPYFYIQRKYAGLDNYVKKITGKEVNDDEMYEIVALLTLEKYGIDFTVEQLAWDWQK